ncbi:30S ribosomal protein S18 [Thermospira aquatica]|nr:30S ribosomal protein S18 [Thermospira aquatica]
MIDKDNELQMDVVVPEEVEKEKEESLEQEGGERGASPEKEKKRFFYSKKVCRFCTGQIKKEEVTYKNVELLRRYIMPSGKILPRRITGTCTKHQRVLVAEIKKARILALLPFLAR